MATQTWRMWVSAWKRATDPEEAGDSALDRSFVVAGAELLVAMVALKLATTWRLGAWGNAMSDLVPLVIKGSVLLAIPTWFFAFVAANAYGQASRIQSSKSRNTLLAMAGATLVLSASCAFLFWGLPVWLRD